jgi:hypothetical protein
VKLKKRTWVYHLKPSAYEVFCDLCGWDGCAWSEFEGHVWCYKCEKDVKGTGGVFGGPIPIELSAMLGMTFHRISLKTGKVSYAKDAGGYTGWRKLTRHSPGGTEGEPDRRVRGKKGGG